MFSVLSVKAQNTDVNKQRQSLEQIRAEIEEYKRKVQSEQAREATILDVLSAHDREIDLIHGLLEQLKKEEKKYSTEILNVAGVIKDKRIELDQLKEIYKKRMINFYKYGRLKDLELLLTADSFNKLLLWIKYQKLIAENDRRIYQNIVEKKRTIENKKDNLKEEIISRRRIIEEKESEEIKLIESKKEREQLLKTVQQNKQLYYQKLKEYELSAKEIERLISIEEEKRLTLDETGIIRNTEFPQLKGQLIWPCQGEVITRFGRYKHPSLKTITESLGIDIKAKFGQDVKSVCSGVVTAITWQRGRGNIVIISHFGGFYTVYTHLSKIDVQIDETVEIGQVIGEVGESGSLRGPMLHFEIWQNNKVLDPIEWLS